MKYYNDDDGESYLEIHSAFMFAFSYLCMCVYKELENFRPIYVKKKEFNFLLWLRAVLRLYVV